MCVALIVLRLTYNDCRMSEKGWVERIVLTALSYVAFEIGATMAAMPSLFDSECCGGLADVAVVVILVEVTGTIAQLTDLADLEGDRLRGRETAPIILGEDVAI